MGTRGAVGFRHNQKDYITYNHYDSYPTCAGVGVIMTIIKQKLFDDKYRQQAIEKLESLQLINSEKTFEPEELENIRNNIEALGLENNTFDPTRFGNGKVDAYYVLNPIQRHINAYIHPKHTIPYMIDSHEFMANSLYCEWAYIINFDTNSLEIYEGFNKNKNAAGRYAGKQRERERNYEPKEQFYGVSLIGEIPFEAVREWKRVDANIFCVKLESYCTHISNAHCEAEHGGIFEEHIKLSPEIMQQAQDNLASLKDLDVPLAQ